MKNYIIQLTIITSLLNIDNLQAQSTYIDIDGSITEYLWGKNSSLFSNNELIIAENDSAYFIAVKTKANAIVNVLLQSDSDLYIFHSSLSVGMAHYKINDSKIGSLSKGFSEYDESWIYRDNKISSAFKGVTFKNSYAKHKWFASTMNMGNIGETEFVISKSIVNKNSKLCILYDESFNLNFFPQQASITNSKNTDFTIHLGNTPNEINFTPSNWLILKND